MKAVVCPVCGGKGTVPAGFYDDWPVAFFTGSEEFCKTCGGLGYIYVLNYAYYRDVPDYSQYYSNPKTTDGQVYL